MTLRARFADVPQVEWDLGHFGWRTLVVVVGGLEDLARRVAGASSVPSGCAEFFKLRFNLFMLARMILSHLDLVLCPSPNNDWNLGTLVLRNDEINLN